MSSKQAEPSTRDVIVPGVTLYVNAGASSISKSPWRYISQVEAAVVQTFLPFKPARVVTVESV